MSGSRDTLADELEILEKYAKSVYRNCISTLPESVSIYYVFAQCIFHCASCRPRPAHNRTAVHQETLEAVLKAEDALQDTRIDASVRATLQQVMHDLGWNRGQVAREIYLICREGGWDSSWLWSTEAVVSTFCTTGEHKVLPRGLFLPFGWCNQTDSPEHETVQESHLKIIALFVCLVIVFCFTIFTGWELHAVRVEPPIYFILY